MLAVDQAMTQAPTEQQCNEQTAGETGCPYRMNVPVHRTNGWRSRMPLPNEREQRTLRLGEWAGDTLAHGGFGLSQGGRR